MQPQSTVDGFRILPTRHNVAEILKRIDSLTQARGIMVFARIDFSGDAARAGLAMQPTGLVILGNPKGGTPLMVATPSVAIDLPLKLLTWEDADGHTWVGYNEPEYLRTRHHFPAELLKNIQVIAALASAVAADDA